MNVRESLSGAQTESFGQRNLERILCVAATWKKGSQYEEDAELDVEMWRQLAVSLS